MEALNERLELLEKTCNGAAQGNLVKQVQDLEHTVVQLLTKYGASNLDFNRLSQLLPPSTASVSKEAKHQIIEARAAEILSQTRDVAYGEGKVPEIETFDIDDLKARIEEIVHEFDEQTTRSAHLARIYLERLNQIR